MLEGDHAVQDLRLPFYIRGGHWAPSSQSQPCSDMAGESHGSSSLAHHSSDAQGSRQGQSGALSDGQPIRRRVNIVMTNQRGVSLGPDLRAGRDMCRQISAQGLDQ